MENLCKKTIAITSAILMLTMCILAVDIPNVNAAAENYSTFGYIGAIPDPVGVNQQAVITFRLDKTPPTASGGSVGDRWQLSVQITKPDGSIENHGPMASDATGGTYIMYTPTAVGTYTLTMTFDGQWINASDSYGMYGFTPGYQRWYEPCTATATMTVQSDPVEGIPNNPLPTGYWTRPIYGENKDWYTIAGNWLMDGYDYVGRSFAGYTAFAPNNLGPESAHIMWTKPIAFGGIIGGANFGDTTYYTGLAYEQLYTPLVIQGRIIYTTAARPPGYGTWCVDLRTGEEIWYINDTINMAQVYNYDSQNQHGGLAYLWVTGGGGMFGAPVSTWKMYDAFTGRWILNVANVTTGTTTFSSDGSILNYNLRTFNVSGQIIPQITLWNSSQAISPWDPNGMQWWRPTTGATIDGSRGIMWSKNLTSFGHGEQSGPVGFGMSVNPSVKRIGKDELGDPTMILLGWGDNTRYPWKFGYAMYSLKYGDEGRMLWSRNVTNMYGTSGERISQNIIDGYFAIFDEPTETLHIYNAETGVELHETESMNNAWGIFSRDYHLAYGNVYTAGYDGHVRAYSLETGELVWDYYFGSAGYETPYGTWPVYNGFTIADGKIYVANDEHSPDGILWRGGKTVCLDAITGEMIWNISGWLRNNVVADGYLTAVNAYDNLIYSIGKGPSATTVSAASTAVPLGTAVTITGTVTDQSPGAKDTPAISDKDMTEWMQYLYQQKPMPADATGVPVKLTATGPNGQTVDIGTTTSDIGGTFGFSWAPNEEGLYKITATFEGTNSYGDSYATTYLTVGSASAQPTTQPTSSVAPTQSGIPTQSPPITTAPASPTPAVEPESDFPTETLLIVGAAVVIIAVIGAAAVLLRKRA